MVGERSPQVPAQALFDKQATFGRQFTEQEQGKDGKTSPPHEHSTPALNSKEGSPRRGKDGMAVLLEEKVEDTGRDDKTSGHI